MIPGLNCNVRHAGVEYHVQTEDLGQQNPFVLTLVFRAGAVIDREKVNYLEVLGDGASERQIKNLMDQQHHRVIRRLLDDQLPLIAASQPMEESLVDWASSLPDVSLPPADKTIDQLILEYLQSRSAGKPR